MRQKTDGLTKKQREVLDFIKKFHADNKYPPSIRQICSAINLSSPATVHVHINHLVEKGYIKRSVEGNKALELLVENEYDKRCDEVVNVPILDEKNKISSNGDLDISKEFFSLPSYLVSDNKNVFIFKVNDNGMINKGILSDDIVVVEKTEEVKNGDVVLSVCDDDVVILRTFYKENGNIRLQPENDMMEAIVLNKVKILGKAIGLYRKF